MLGKRQRDTEEHDEEEEERGLRLAIELSKQDNPDLGHVESKEEPKPESFFFPWYLLTFT